jgi:hypothetical protein
LSDIVGTISSRFFAGQKFQGQQTVTGQAVESVACA